MIDDHQPNSIPYLVLRWWHRLPGLVPVTPKTVHRVLALKGWLVHQRPVTLRPRAQGESTVPIGPTSAGPPI